MRNVVLQETDQWLSDKFPLKLGQFSATSFVLLADVSLNKMSFFTTTNNPAYTKLHLSGLPDNPSETRLLQLFTFWNIPVLHIRIHRDQDSHKQKGFGFMWVRKSDAVRYINTKRAFKGKWLKIKKAVSPKRKTPLQPLPPA